MVMVFNATSNNISVISWQSQVTDKLNIDLTHNVVTNTPCHEWDSNSQL
jgi:hypothetical protein